MHNAIWHEQFQKLGLPHRRNELWKYTAVENFLQITPFLESLKDPSNNKKANPPKLPKTFMQATLGFDGRQWSSNIPSLIVENLLDEKIAYPFNQQLVERDGLYNLHRTLHSKVYCKIPNKLTVLCLLWPADLGNKDIPEICLDFSEHQGAITIYDCYTGQKTSESTLLTSLEIKNPHSQITLHRFGETNLPKIVSWLKIDNASSCNVFCWHKEDHQFKSYIAVNNIAANAQATITVLADLAAQSHLDLTTQVNHLTENTTANQIFKVILKEKAWCSLTGKIFIDRNCPKTVSHLNSKHLLLADNAHIHSQPQLEIFSDDVECAHGSSTGSLQNEEIFYLTSRGINPEQAKKMLLKSIFLEEINKLASEEEKSYFKDYLQC